MIDGYQRVVDYVFKTIKGRVSYDEEMLVLPRTRDELTSKLGGFELGVRPFRLELQSINPN